jgi:hypothetical protein
MRSDGFGAQYQSIIETILYCRNNNMDYLYSPFVSVEHNYDNDPTFCDKLENLMNLKDNIQNNNTQLHTTELGISHVFNAVEPWLDFYCNSDTMSFIKECFWKNKDRDHFKNNKFNVAVQIRRENAHDRGCAWDRITTPNNYYLDVMNIIREKYKHTPIQFHIYSHGDINNFTELIQDDVEMHIDEDLISTFIGLVAADILITSTSSFSYVAALLSDGIVYYKQFWHPPKKAWICFV